MIYTFTLNPSIDYFLKVESDPLTDEVNRGTDTVFKAGGKGLNVSRVLSVLDVPSKAVALLGGFTGDFIRSEVEKDKNIELVEVKINGINRINTKAHFRNRALCINGEGPEADEEAKDQLFEVLNEIEAGDTAVLSGSMMRGLTNEDLIAMTDQIHEKKAKLVIDMEKISLDVLKRCRPDLIKPNLYELQILLKDPSIMKEDAEDALLRLKKEGIENVLLSLGKDGAVLMDEEDLLYLEQPDTDLVNKVGAGDAMLAGYLGTLEKTGDRELALRYAGAAGNAAASQIEDITKETVLSFLPLMNIRTYQV